MGAARASAAEMDSYLPSSSVLVDDGRSNDLDGVSSLFLRARVRPRRSKRDGMAG